jgi:hypothetical protein
MLGAADLDVDADQFLGPERPAAVEVRKAELDLIAALLELGTGLQQLLVTLACLLGEHLVGRFRSPVP